MQLNQEFGSYIPSLFLIRINTEEDLSNFDRLDPETKCTLIHEYVHFLQDITTLFGLLGIFRFRDTMYAACHSILEYCKYEFLVPVDLQKYPQVVDQNKSFNLWTGAYNLTVPIKNYESYIKVANTIHGFDSEPSILVKYTDYFGEEHAFTLGSYCILESMAANVEKYVGETLDSVDFSYSEGFPYSVVEELLKVCFPKFPINRENTIVLCEISLHSVNPGLQMVEILERMEKFNCIIVDYNDIYNFYSDQKLYFDGLHLYPNDFEIFANRAKDNLRELFSLDSERPLRDWCEKIIDTGSMLHNEKWGSFLFDTNKEKRIDKIFQLINRIGLPLLRNNNEQNYYSNVLVDIGDAASYLRAINEVYEIFFGSRKCKLRNFCEIGEQKITDNRCDNSPWERATDTERCPVGQLWYKWKLKGYSPLPII